MKPQPARNIDDDITHHSFEFVRDAYVWLDDEPVNVNLAGFAGQIHDWMQQKGFVNYYVEADKRNYPHLFTNPDTFHASTLAQCWQTLVNEAGDFSKGLVATDRFDAEVKYLRLRSELIINGCRLIEALIKQLLYCTDFSRGDYKDATIGRLIAFDCKACRRAGKKAHKISMLGSVGHRYGLCHGYEECVNKNIRRLAKLRNNESSHASTKLFEGLGSTKAREAMKDDLMAIGNNVHHILRHLRDYEDHMIKELEANIRLRNTSLVVIRMPIAEWNKTFPEFSVSLEEGDVTVGNTTDV